MNHSISRSNALKKVLTFFCPVTQQTVIYLRIWTENIRSCFSQRLMAEITCAKKKKKKEEEAGFSRDSAAELHRNL